MARTEYRLRLLPKQAAILNSTDPTLVYWGGNGIGKTYLGVHWTLIRLLTWRDARLMLVCMTYSSFDRTAKPYLERCIRDMGLANQIKWNHGTNEITCAEMGTRLWIATAEKPVSLEGPDLSAAWCDEIGFWRESSYRVIQTRLRYQTEDMRTRGQRCQQLLTYTPRFAGWAVKRFSAQEKRDGETNLRGCLFDNPNLDPSIVTRLREQFGEGSAWWRQTVYGDAVDPEGLVFSDFSDVCIADPPSGVQWRGHAGGVDWGWTNPKALLVVGVDQDGIAYVRDEWVKPNADMANECIPAAKAFRDQYGVAAWFCDPSSPEDIRAFQNAGLNAVPANNAVVPGVTNVNSRFRTNRLFISPKCETLLSEIGAYEWVKGTDGTWKRDTPAKVSDHCCDSVRYACAGIDGLSSEQEQDDRRVHVEDLDPQFVEFRGGFR